ncbi:unnamed protein product [Plutella xylostella]|uniref:(diamondback moth) hypothetical protein n=1 Tax=Plutella xylostella TaxID=51655 RepID=A0A8S4DKY4_PLUXY|nr:unnamed protein product [Plutella xylostella]
MKHIPAAPRPRPPQPPARPQPPRRGGHSGRANHNPVGRRTRDTTHVRAISCSTTFNVLFYLQDGHQTKEAEKILCSIQLQACVTPCVGGAGAAQAWRLPPLGGESSRLPQAEDDTRARYLFLFRTSL